MVFKHELVEGVSRDLSNYQIAQVLEVLVKQPSHSEIETKWGVTTCDEYLDALIEVRSVR